LREKGRKSRKGGRGRGRGERGTVKKKGVEGGEEGREREGGKWLEKAEGMEAPCCNCNRILVTASVSLLR